MYLLSIRRIFVHYDVADLNHDLRALTRVGPAVIGSGGHEEK